MKEIWIIKIDVRHTVCDRRQGHDAGIVGGTRGREQVLGQREMSQVLDTEVGLEAIIGPSQIAGSQASVIHQDMQRAIVRKKLRNACTHRSKRRKVQGSNDDCRTSRFDSQCLSYRLSLPMIPIPAVRPVTIAHRPCRSWLATTSRAACRGWSASRNAPDQICSCGTVAYACFASICLHLRENLRSAWSQQHMCPYSPQIRPHALSSIAGNFPPTTGPVQAIRRHTVSAECKASVSHGAPVTCFPQRCGTR